MSSGDGTFVFKREVKLVLRSHEVPVRARRACRSPPDGFARLRLTKCGPLWRASLARELPRPARLRLPTEARRGAALTTALASGTSGVLGGACAQAHSAWYARRRRGRSMPAGTHRPQHNAVHVRVVQTSLEARHVAPGLRVPSSCHRQRLRQRDRERAGTPACAGSRRTALTPCVAVRAAVAVPCRTVPPRSSRCRSCSSARATTARRPLS